MKNLFLKHFRFLSLLLFITHLQAGPCISLPRQDHNQELLLFTHHHIATQKEKALKKHREEIIWKTQPYTHWKCKQKIFYKNLPLPIQQNIVEFAGLHEPPREGSYYYTPLQKAILDSNYTTVQLLIALGVDINGNPAGCKETPLFISIRWEDKNEVKHYAIFKYLLAHGADYNKPNGKENYNSNSESTPLHKTVFQKTNIQFLHDLLNMPNINVNTCNRYGETFLDSAKKNAMYKRYTVEYRKYAYTVCAVLESAGAQSSIMLQPMPTDEK